MDYMKIIEIPIAKCSQNLDFSVNKKILIAGSNSYIGESFKKYMNQFENYQIDSFDTKSSEWENLDFSQYDVVYDVAGIVHIKETDDNRHLYYDINRDLAVRIAKKAKEQGIKQFIYLSTMSVYGLVEGRINKKTKVNPINAYGKSKVEAEQLLWKMNDENFKISIIRPPMVYGKGCKGNYQTLRKFALKFGIFPDYDNERSMIFIDNLSSSIRGVIHNEESGLYYPQNIEYMKTTDIVKEIVKLNGKKFTSFKFINPFIKLFMKKIIIFKKIFGTLTYEKNMNVIDNWIDIKDNKESIKFTEKARNLK